jgi:hypothetical protein
MRQQCDSGVERAKINERHMILKKQQLGDKEDQLKEMIKMRKKKEMAVLYL